MKITLSTVITSLSGQPFAIGTRPVEKIAEDGSKTVENEVIPLTVGDAIRTALESPVIDEKTNQQKHLQMAEILKRLSIAAKLKQGDVADFEVEELAAIQELVRTSLNLPVVLFLVDVFRGTPAAAA